MCAAIECLEQRAQMAVALLLEQALRKALHELEKKLTRGDRQDWAPTCLALCIIFFAIENLQVNVYLRCLDAEAICLSTETAAIQTLAHLFAAHTRNFNPLWLDWSEDETLFLVNSDQNMGIALENIQLLSQEYGTCPSISSIYS